MARPTCGHIITSTINAIVSTNGKRDLIPMRWGLVPGWWNKPLKELRLATFNARAETVQEKPFFRSAFIRSRCLIPVSGYYEWQDTPSGKQPYYFTRSDGQVMTIAGLWDEWTDKETGTKLQSCAMVITEANAYVAQVHDRMPVVLDPNQFEQWERGNAQDAAAIMKPTDRLVMEKWPVSTRVNSSRASDDDATLIDRLSEPNGFFAR